MDRHKIDNSPFDGIYGENEYPMERIRNTIGGILHIIISLQSLESSKELPQEITELIRLAKKFDVDGLINYLHDEEILCNKELMKKWFI